MKIAIVTNDAKTVAEHIGLAKQIAFYTLPDGTLESIVTNPVLENIDSAKASQSPDGERRLRTGRILPPFLAEHGTDIFVAHDLGKGVTDGLLQLGITPVGAEEPSIDALLATLKARMQ